MKLNNISTGILIVCILCGIVTAATTISDTSISVDNLILGGQTIVAYTAALNTKLSGIETLADVTDATNVNAAGAMMESDIPDQSFTNLLPNYDFESWSAGTAVVPDGWQEAGTGFVAREATIIKCNAYSANLTYSSGYVIYTYVLDFNRYKGQTVTLSCWVYTSVPNQARFRINDGVSSTYSAYHTGGGGWELITVTRVLSNSASQLAIELSVGAAGSAYFDGAILVEGLVCPAPNPKPLVDDGIMLQLHTPSSASDYGATGQWCYDNDYIYVCNNTDTWIRTSLTTW